MMAHYSDVILPNSFAFGAKTDPQWLTDRTFLPSGYLKTNQRRSRSIRQFDISYNIRDESDVYTLLKIWEAVNGPANSFLMRDPNDWNTTDGLFDYQTVDASITATDQVLQNTVDSSFYGDGSTTTFQAVKRYVSGSGAYTRKIKFIESGSLSVALDGAAQTEGVDYTVNYNTGIITFTTAPGSGSPTGEAPTWGGKFYVPVKFIDDSFPLSREMVDLGAVERLVLYEDLEAQA